MKLRGRQTEQDYRAQLIESHQALESNPKLLKVLKTHFPQMITAYVIHWIPEQGEEFFKVLINDDLIAKVELSHNETVPPIIDTITIHQYLHRLSRSGQIQLAVALSLVKTDLQNYHMSPPTNNI